MRGVNKAGADEERRGVGGGFNARCALQACVTDPSKARGSFPGGWRMWPASVPPPGDTAGRRSSGTWPRVCFPRDKRDREYRGF